MSHGYFGIGIIGCKSHVNIGVLWRSAYVFGAAYLFVIAPRFARQLHRKQRTDTVDAKRHVPYFVHETPEHFFAACPYQVPLVGIELHATAQSLEGFVHPKQAVYLLGAEDKGIPEYVLERCNAVLQIQTPLCLNVGVAGSLVMYDRHVKQGRWRRRAAGQED